MKEFSSDFAVYHLEDNGILIGKIHEGARIELKDMLHDVSVRKKMLGPNRYPLIINFNGIRSMSRDAQTIPFYDKNNCTYSRIAVIAQGFTPKLIVAFAMGRNKPCVPIEQFEEEEAAREWIQKQQEIKGPENVRKKRS